MEGDFVVEVDRDLCVMSASCSSHAPKTFSHDAKLFPTFNDQLRSAMLKETELFFAEIVREDHSVLDLIDGRYTYLNDRLSWHYNITDTVGTRGTAKPARFECSRQREHPVRVEPDPQEPGSESDTRHACRQR